MSRRAIAALPPRRAACRAARPTCSSGCPPSSPSSDRSPPSRCRRRRAPACRRPRPLPRAGRRARRQPVASVFSRSFSPTDLLRDVRLIAGRFRHLARRCGWAIRLSVTRRFAKRKPRPLGGADGANVFGGLRRTQTLVTATRISPILPIAARISSPGRIGPTPSGVPESRMSPGSSV